MHSERGISTYLVVIGLAILALGVPLGSFFIDYMQGVQKVRVENRFGAGNGEEENFDGPPEDYVPGGYTVTYDL